MVLSASVFSSGPAAAPEEPAVLLVPLVVPFGPAVAEETMAKTAMIDRAIPLRMAATPLSGGWVEFAAESERPKYLAPARGARPGALWRRRPACTSQPTRPLHNPGDPLGKTLISIDLCFA